MCRDPPRWRWRTGRQIKRTRYGGFVELAWGIIRGRGFERRGQPSGENQSNQSPPAPPAKVDFDSLAQTRSNGDNDRTDDENDGHHDQRGSNFLVPTRMSHARPH